MRLMFDAEAVNALPDRRHPAERRVRRAMEAARRLHRDVAIATGTLAGLYRGAGRNQSLDALLARDSGLRLLGDTDRSLARLIGALRSEAGAGSACSRTLIPSQSRSRRVEGLCRRLIPMALAD